MSTVMEQPTLGLKEECKTSSAPPINLTDRAVIEVKKIISEQQAAGEQKPMYLRLRIVGGGCSGFQPKLDLDLTVNDKLDEVFEVGGVDVVIDKRSLLYVVGTTVDFHDDLNRRGFSVVNPNAKSTCGCGSSFSM
jgi:iron-sulfur cluster insertion protein